MAGLSGSRFRAGLANPPHARRRRWPSRLRHVPRSEAGPVSHAGLHSRRSARRKRNPRDRPPVCTQRNQHPAVHVRDEALLRGAALAEADQVVLDGHGDPDSALLGPFPLGSLLGGGLSFKAQVLMLGRCRPVHERDLAVHQGTHGIPGLQAGAAEDPWTACVPATAARAGSSDRQQIARNAEGRAAGGAA